MVEFPPTVSLLVTVELPTVQLLVMMPSRA